MFRLRQLWEFVGGGARAIIIEALGVLGIAVIAILVAVVITWLR